MKIITKTKSRINCNIQINLLEKALHQSPGNIKLLRNYYTLLIGEKEIKKGLNYFEEAIETKKITYDLMEMYCILCCRNNDPTSALNFLTRATKNKRLRTLALALSAQIEGCRTISAYSPMFNLDRDIKTIELDISDSSLNALRGLLRQDPRLVYEQTTPVNKGYQAFIDKKENIELSELTLNIEHHCYQYAQQLRSINHPIINTPDTNFQFKYWSVVLQQQGYLSSHNHPNGFISGSCYLQTPTQNTGRSGQLEIGCPPEGLSSQMQSLFIEPRPRLLVLFPSYYYHRTIPVKTQEKRMCLAFDAKLT